MKNDILKSIDEHKKINYDQHKKMMLNNVFVKTQLIKQKHSESLTNVDLPTFIDFFKNNPDKLNEIIVSLRKDKIEKIRSNVGTRN